MVTQVYKPALPILKKMVILIRIKDEVDPHLQMAAIHLRVFEHQGPAIPVFENVKGSKFPAVSNLFVRWIVPGLFSGIRWSKLKTLVELKNDPIKSHQAPF